ATRCARSSPARSASTTPRASPSAPPPRTASGSPGAARGSPRKRSRCFVAPREHAPKGILEPVEREVELLRRVVELLVHPRDRPAQRRVRGDHVPVADLRHL